MYKIWPLISEPTLTKPIYIKLYIYHLYSSFILAFDFGTVLEINDAFRNAIIFFDVGCPVTAPVCSSCFACEKKSQGSGERESQVIPLHIKATKNKHHH